MSEQMEYLGRSLAKVVMNGAFWDEIPNGDDLTTLLRHFVAELTSLTGEEDDTTLLEIIEFLREVK